MKNLTENEMVMVLGGSKEFDAWEDGYNCLKCRTMVGSIINRAFLMGLVGLLFSGGNIGAAIGNAVTSVISDSDKAREATQWCIACFHDVFE